MEHITEAGMRFTVPGTAEIPTRSMPVFYNPEMEENREIACAIIRAEDRPLRIALPLAGSGIRAMRMASISRTEIQANDHAPEAFSALKKNLKGHANVTVKNQDADIFLLSSKGFDYIDIDPFGSPAPFLDAAVKRLSRNGILAVTATDTAPLCGTYPKACRRKYGATPVRTPLMYDTGLRILIQKIQRIGTQYEKALTPMLSYMHRHYFRVYLRCKKGKRACDAIIDQLSMISVCAECQWHAIGLHETCPVCTASLFQTGSLWTGRLQDRHVINRLDPKGTVEKIRDELDIFGYYHIPSLCKHLGVSTPPFPAICEKIRQTGHEVSRTHLELQSLRTTLPLQQLLQILEKS